MKQCICTTPEQGKRLLACGLDPKSADFVWMDDKPNNPRLTLRTEIIEDSNPYILGYGWSLGRILAILEDYEPRLEFLDGRWECGVGSTEKLRWPHDGTFICADTQIEAVVLLIERLHEFGYKLNEIKQ